MKIVLISVGILWLMVFGALFLDLRFVDDDFYPGAVMAVGRVLFAWVLMDGAARCVRIWRGEDR